MEEIKITSKPNISFFVCNLFFGFFIKKEKNQVEFIFVVLIRGYFYHLITDRKDKTAKK